MGKEKDLTDYEKGQIDALNEQGLNKSEIGRRVNRNRTTISKYLNANRSSRGKKASGRKEKFDCRTKRRIFKLVTTEGMSCNSVKNCMGLKETRWTVLRCLHANGNVKYASMKKCPLLKPVHITKRLDFARKFMDFGNKWATVLFSDEKKFNLDGPDGFKYYWHDLRKEHEIFSKRVSGGGSVMVWAGIAQSGKTDIIFAKGKMNSQHYQNMIEPQLTMFGERICGPQWLFQQDNAPIHSSMSSKNWFISKGIRVLDWPPLSPDINPIENIWAVISRDIYKSGRQYANIETLKEAILESWRKLPIQFLNNVIESMPKRIFELIRLNGRKINY